MKIAKFILTTTLLFIVSATTVSAYELKSGANLQVEQGENIGENFYFASNKFSNFGTVEGDMLGIAETIITSGTTTRDKLLGGVNLNLEGNTQDDVRALGGEINIHGNIDGEAILLGSQITVHPEAEIEQGAILIANHLNLEGKINSSTRVFARKVFMDGEIGGNLHVNSLVFDITENAKIDGNLDYTAEQKAKISSDQQVGGTVSFTPTSESSWPIQKQQDKSLIQKIADRFNHWWWISLLSELIAGLALFWLFKNKIKSMMAPAVNNFSRNSLVGLAVIILLPALLVGLFTSIFGFWLSVILALVFMLLLVLSKIGAGMLIGSILGKYSFNKPEFTLSWNSLAVGIIILAVLSVIPVVGWFIEILFGLAVFGGLISRCWTHLRGKSGE
ncbi:MAG: hypothetical protein ABEJ02_02035 [Candidatus Paceibacteria bacterium]